MGRKKIKIRPIKDDRNRAVTFLKRKNGLFKKAFELAVLCRAEVAVIVFAGNKKLYEFASSDIKDVLYRYTQAPEAYEHRGPEDFQNKEDADSDDSDDGGADLSSDHYQRIMSHTPQPHGTPQFTPQMHHRRTSNDSIVSDRRQSLQHHIGTPQLVPHRTPPLHPRHGSTHMNTPPQHFQVPLAPSHGSPQPAHAVRQGMMQPQQMQHGVSHDNMGLGIGVAPQPYGMNYNPYGHPVYISAQDNAPRRPSSTHSYQYEQQHQNPYQPSPPLTHQQQPHQPPPQPESTLNLPPQPQVVTEIKSKGRMKSIHTPVSTRASSLAAHFDTTRTHYERPPHSNLQSHSVDSSNTTPQSQQILPPSVPLSNSPPPITTNTPGSTSNQSTGQRPKLSLHIPDDEDPTQQQEDSPVSATPGTASPEISRQDHGAKEQRRRPNSAPTSASPNIQDPHELGHHRRNSQGETFFLPPPTSASSLHPNSRLPGPGLGAFDSGASGGTPLSALPSRYAGDMLPSPSTFYPEFYGNLPSAGTSNMRGGFGGLMNGTPIVARAEEGSLGFGGFGSAGGNGGGGEKRRAEENQGGANKRARS